MLPTATDIYNRIVNKTNPATWTSLFIMPLIEENINDTSISTMNNIITEVITKGITEEDFILYVAVEIMQYFSILPSVVSKILTKYETCNEAKATNCSGFLDTLRNYIVHNPNWEVGLKNALTNFSKLICSNDAFKNFFFCSTVNLNEKDDKLNYKLFYLMNSIVSKSKDYLKTDRSDQNLKISKKSHNPRIHILLSISIILFIVVIFIFMLK